jgi:hypothetical protein
VARGRGEPGRGPRSSCALLRHRHFSPSPTLAMSAQTLELLLIAYGSRDTDTLSDDRYGADQRRLEIALRPKLPRAGMNPQEISEWANLWSTLQYQSIKHRCVGTFTSERRSTYSDAR